MKKRIMKINNNINKIAKGIIFISLAFFVISGCTSYKTVYKELNDSSDRINYYLLLYRVPSKRIKYILNQSKDKKNLLLKKEIEKIAKKLNMDKHKYRMEQIKRIRTANIKYGTLEKGMFSDRGRIYIKYGKPDSIRTMDDDEYGQIIQWSYSKYNKKFRFRYNTTKRSFHLINLYDDTM